MASIALHEIGHLVPGKLFDVKTTEILHRLRSQALGRGVEVRPSTASRRFRWAAMSGSFGMFRRQRTGTGQVRTLQYGAVSRACDNARRRSGRRSVPRTRDASLREAVLAEVDHHGQRPDDEYPAGILVLLGVSLSLWRLSPPVDDQQGPGMHCRPRMPPDQSCVGKPATPAAQSGIQPGDKIRAFNGTPVSSCGDVSRLIRSNLDHPRC
jgi:hypothetical protein